MKRSVLERRPVTASRAKIDTELGAIGGLIDALNGVNREYKRVRCSVKSESFICMSINDAIEELQKRAKVLEKAKR